MMSMLIRPLLVPGVALATVGAMAMGPMLVTPPTAMLAQPAVQVPVVHIAEVELAGFTLDLYNALNGWAQFGVQVLQDFFYWNPAIAAQIGNLYTSLEPIITAVVTFIDTLTAGPTDIITALTSIVTNLLPAFGIGLPSLSAAAVGKSSAPLAAARTAPSRGAAVTSAPDSGVAELPAAELPAAELPAEVAAEAPVPARASRGALHRAAKPSIGAARQAAGSATAEAATAPAEAAAAAETPAPTAARAARGSAAKAAREARGAVTAAAAAAS
jgi:hypothetical protein